MALYEVKKPCIDEDFVISGSYHGVALQKSLLVSSGIYQLFYGGMTTQGSSDGTIEIYHRAADSSSSVLVDSLSVYPYDPSSLPTIFSKAFTIQTKRNDVLELRTVGTQNYKMVFELLRIS